MEQSRKNSPESTGKLATSRRNSQEAVFVHPDHGAHATGGILQTIFACQAACALRNFMLSAFHFPQKESASKVRPVSDLRLPNGLFRPERL
jgi:hypothetical protein